MRHRRPAWRFALSVAGVAALVGPAESSGVNDMDGARTFWTMGAMPTTRRQFLGGAAALAAGGLARPAIAQAKPKVVLVGGGAGGATAAKYIAMDSAGAIEVTLVEPSRTYTTCFHSNLYLGGFRSFESITHSYGMLGSKYGIALVHQAAAAIDRDRKSVRLADGNTLSYDRLVLAPGIDLKFDTVPGYSEQVAEVMPHAWKAGPQTQLLKKQLDALTDGATIVVIPPPDPARCPPGPYERVSMMAHILKAKGHKRSRIIILDPKPRFPKQALFAEGWQKYYTGMIEWQDPEIHGGVTNVDAETKTVVTDLASYKADLVNVIPAQWAGHIARNAGLANSTGYCPIDAASMKSQADGNIFIVGDACIPGDMPKSAFAANSQAKVAAMTIRNELTKAPAFPAHYLNTCWSLIQTDDAVKVGGQYEPRNGKIAAVETFVSQTEESAELRRNNQEENMAWYAAITADMFS